MIDIVLMCYHFCGTQRILERFSLGGKSGERKVGEGKYFVGRISQSPPDDIIYERIHSTRLDQTPHLGFPYSGKLNKGNGAYITTQVTSCIPEAFF